MQDVFKAPRTKRILIVEDNPVHRELMEGELSGEYELELAADSESALACLKENQPLAYDLVIVDLNLPIRVGEPATTEEGRRILQNLQENFAGSPPVVLVVSGNLIDSTRKQVEKMGVRRIFEKPFSLIELREFIDSLFEKGVLSSYP